MKVYGDLIVRGNTKSLGSFIAALQQNLTNGWTRYSEREQQIARVALGPMYCFACTSLGARPRSVLWLATRSDGEFYVSNILAEELPSLTHDQYNSILSDFYGNCAKPAAESCGASIELTKFDPQLEDYMSSATARLLRSSLANRSILHAFDRKRWNEFLVSAYKEGARLDAESLKRWLIEDEKWPEDEALNLAIEYEHARGLLEIYETQPAY